MKTYIGKYIDSVEISCETCKNSEVCNNSGMLDEDSIVNLDGKCGEAEDGSLLKFEIENDSFEEE